MPHYDYFSEAAIRDEFASYLEINGISNKKSKQKYNYINVRTEFFYIDILAQTEKGSYDVFEIKKSVNSVSKAVGQVLEYCYWLEGYLLKTFGDFCYRPIIAALGELNNSQEQILEANGIAYYNIANYLPRFNRGVPFASL